MVNYSLKKKQAKKIVLFIVGSINSKRASSRGLIPRAKVKTVKITFVIITGKCGLL